MGADSELTNVAKRLAMEAGFTRVGVAPAGQIPGRERFRRWLSSGGHGEMGYLARNVAKRFDPRLLVEGAQGVICVVLSYAPPDDAPPLQIARYARGRDYHRVVRQRLRRLMDRLRELEPEFAGRAFVDSAPLAERSLAVLAGLGWIGRNGCLIVPGAGSYVVLGEIVCNLPLIADKPIAGGCGDCDLCVRACPTGAIDEDGTVDARLCLSYLTVEHRGPIDRRVAAGMGERLFGCDACQQACPHNADVPAGDPELTLERPVARVNAADVLEWTEPDWDVMTRGSTTRRAGWTMWLRNAAIARGNSGDSSARPDLLRLASGAGPAADAARWAMERLQDRPTGG